MSAVPPSPANPTAVKSVMPRARKPASIPVSIEAVPANVESIALFEKQSCGKLNPTADMQPAGSTATAFLPRTFSAFLTARLPPHPAHALWP